MLEIENVSLKVKKTKILRHVSLSCDSGKIYGIIGRNGSGKTMLMKCICGFVRPTEGEITVMGKRIGRDVDFIPDAGMIIETPGFIPYYSGMKNLKLLAAIQNKVGVPEIRKAMELVGLDPDLKKSVRKYSLGMRQREKICGYETIWKIYKNGRQKIKQER